MSDDSTEQTVNPETGETETGVTDDVEQVEEQDGDKKSVRGGRRQNLLSRPTDFVERPGFRNPANKRSKASKKRRRKK